jgi:hypothetical protein
MLLCGMRPQPLELMRNLDFQTAIGPENICPTVRVAVMRANAILAKQQDQTHGLSTVLESH